VASLYWHLIALLPEIGFKEASMDGWLQKTTQMALLPKLSL
jgi:hypothetical protein